VKQGESVMAVDLRGLGETQGGVLGDRDDKLGLEWKDAFVAYLLGTSYLAKRAEDILVCARAAVARGGATPRIVKLEAAGQAVPAALHAAALEPGFPTCDATGWPARLVRRPLRPAGGEPACQRRSRRAARFTICPTCCTRCRRSLCRSPRRSFWRLPDCVRSNDV